MQDLFTCNSGYLNKNNLAKIEMLKASNYAII